MNTSTTVIGLVILAVVLGIAAILYAVGAISFGTTAGTHHYKHAIALGILAIAAAAGASFARPKTA